MQLKNSDCKQYAAPFDVRLILEKEGKEITTVVQPDLTIICDENKLDQRGCLGSPDMVVEILSPRNSKKEMIQKYHAQIQVVEIELGKRCLVQWSSTFYFSEDGLTQFYQNGFENLVKMFGGKLINN